MLRCTLPIGLAGLLLLLSSCTSELFTGISYEYPAGWASVEGREDPENAIAGSYANFGDHSFNPIATRDSSRVALGSLLLEVSSDAISADDVVRVIRVGPGVLRLELLKNGVVTQGRTLEAGKDEFRVAEGAVWLSTKKKSYGDGTGYVWEKDSLGLRRSADSALVCEWRHGSAALALWVIPMKGSQTFWFRWPQAANPQSSQKEPNQTPEPMPLKRHGSS